jgi:tetratricopeptide (TPR) repeat protein
MVAAGPRVRLATDVYDLGSGRSVGQAQIEGSADSVLALIDRLGMQALGVILEKDPGEFHTVDLAGVTTSSLVALKAYLEGAARFRRSELAPAIAAWQRAVDVDTTFALAYFGLAEAYGWDETSDPAKSQEMLDRARRLAYRLPTREATLVRTTWAVRNAEPGYLAATEDAVRRYPDDAEAWYNLGEAYFHLAGAMRGPEETEHTFRGAAELQPGSALYRAHLVDLVFQWRPDSARIAREVEAYGRLAPQAARSRAGRIAFAFGFGDSAARAEALGVLDSVDRETATLVYAFLTHPRFADAREAVFAAVDPRLDERDWALMGFLRLRDLGFMDGQVRRALTLVDDPRASAVVRYCGPFSLSVDGLPVPEHILEARLALSRADSSSFSSQTWVTCAAAHAAQRGRWRDHAALLSRARELARRELAAGDSVGAREWHQVAGWAEAHGLWRRGRKEEALRTFESVLASDSHPSWSLWYVGQLAFELGRLELAERAFQALWQWDGPPAYLYLGRIYERTGRIAEALDAYRFVNYAWRAADPELEPLVAEARQAVARLSGAEE